MFIPGDNDNISGFVAGGFTTISDGFAPSAQTAILAVIAAAAIIALVGFVAWAAKKVGRFFDPGDEAASQISGDSFRVDAATSMSQPDRQQYESASDYSQRMETLGYLYTEMSDDERARYNERNA